MAAASALAHTLRVSTFVALGLLAIVVLLWLTRKYSRNLPTAGTWTAYLKGQGALLLVFLLLGGAFAWLGSFGRPQPNLLEHGKLLEFRQLDPSQQPVVKDVDVENFAQITVMTKTAAPQGGSATITLYPDTSDASGTQIYRIQSRADDWSRWDQPNSSKLLRLIVAPPTEPGTVSASQVDVLIYLAPQQPGSKPKL